GRPNITPSYPAWREAPDLLQPEAFAIERHDRLELSVGRATRSWVAACARSSTRRTIAAAAKGGSRAEPKGTSAGSPRPLSHKHLRSLACRIRAALTVPMLERRDSNPDCSSPRKRQRERRAPDDRKGQPSQSPRWLAATTACTTS